MESCWEIGGDTSAQGGQSPLRLTFVVLVDSLVEQVGQRNLPRKRGKPRCIALCVQFKACGGSLGGRPRCHLRHGRKGGNCLSRGGGSCSGVRVVQIW